MTHIKGKRDAWFHDGQGRHVAPRLVERDSCEYRDPSGVLGSVVRGTDVERWERALKEFAAHVKAHEEVGDVIEYGSGAS